MHTRALSLVAVVSLVVGAAASPAVGYHGLAHRPSTTTSVSTTHDHHHTRTRTHHQSTSTATPPTVLVLAAPVHKPVIDVDLLSNDPTKARLADVRIGSQRRLSSRLFGGGKNARDTYYYQLADGRVVKVVTQPSKPGYLLDVDVLGGHRSAGSGSLLDVDLLRRRWTAALGSRKRQFVTDPDAVETVGHTGSAAVSGAGEGQQQAMSDGQHSSKPKPNKDEDKPNTNVHSYSTPNKDDDENKPAAHSYSHSNSQPHPNSVKNSSTGKPNKSNGKNGQVNAADVPSSSTRVTKVVYYAAAEPTKHHKPLIDLDLNLKRRAARYLRRNMDEVLGQKDVKMTAEVAAAEGKDRHHAITAAANVQPTHGAQVHGSVDDHVFFPGGIRQGAVKFPFYIGEPADEPKDSSTTTSTTTSTTMTSTSSASTTTTHDALPTVFVAQQQHTGGSLLDLDLNLGHILRREDEDDEDEDCPMMDDDDEDEASTTESAMPTTTTAAEARQATFPPISFDTNWETSTDTSTPMPTPSSTSGADAGAMNAASKPQSGSGSEWSGNDRRPTAYEPQAAMNIAQRPKPAHPVGAGAMDYVPMYNHDSAVEGKHAQAA